MFNELRGTYKNNSMNAKKNTDKKFKKKQKQLHELKDFQKVQNNTKEISFS
jgi:hypothetical protein